MLIYKQRYKPRTTREFTKSDLIVYDSAGNTALNALTVYGKSEVVNGAIKSAGDSGTIEIETCKKNLFDPTKLVTENITYTDGTLSGTAANFSNAFASGIPILFSKTKQITFSAKVYTNGETTSGSGLRVIFAYKDNTTDILYILNNTTTPQFFTLTSNATKQVQNIEITYGSVGSNIWYLSEIQLEYGSIATAYEPYNGTMAVFTTGTPLRGIPDSNVRDVMAWDGSAGTVTKKCGEVDLGTLTWRQTSTPSIFYADQLSSAKVPSNLYCAKYTKGNYASLSNKCIAIGNSQALPIIRIRDDSYTDATAFNTSLSGVKLVYELATPTTEQLTSTENASITGLRTFQPQTHAQNNAQTDMTVDYTIRVPTI